MPYRYSAFTPAGEQVSGLLDAETETAAERTLWDRNLTIIDLEPVGEPLNLAKLLPTFFGPRRQDVIVFAQQLANLIESGVGLVPALDLLAEEVASRPMRRVIAQVADGLRLGVSLSSSLGRHETVFPPVFQRMMEVGERTGNLGMVLRQMATYLEKEHAVSRKVSSALAYPAFLLVMAVGVVLVVFTFTLPPLQRLYDEFDAELPTITRIIMDLAEFLLAYQVLLVAGLLVLILLVAWYLSLPAGRRRFHLMLLRLPLVRSVVIQGAVARLSRTLATLISAGVPLPESLGLSRQIIGNQILEETIEELRDETLQGRGLSAPLSRSRYFPAMLAQMVRVGEETGTLDASLMTLSSFYEEEVDRMVDRLTSMIEPALIIFVGLVVGLVALSTILPMYTLLQSIR